MRLFLFFVLVVSAAPTVTAKDRLRGERRRRLIEHDPKVVGRVLKEATSRKGLYANTDVGGIDNALAAVEKNLAKRKGSKGGASTTVSAATTEGTPVATTSATSESATTATSESATASTTTGSAKSSKESRSSSSLDTVSFFHLAPNAAVPVTAGDEDFDELGTVFLYGGGLYDATATEIPGANFTGVCTKTQVREVLDATRTLVGGGYCHFTYVLQVAADGSPLVTMNAVGEVFDVAGGVMSITGGTDLLATASGEIVIEPLYNSSLDYDFFTQAIVYQVNATIL